MRYLVIASFCISVFYLVYIFLVKRLSNFKQMRFYLLISILLALLLPFNSYKIDYSFLGNNNNTYELVQKVNNSAAVNSEYDTINNKNKRQSIVREINWILVLSMIYVFVVIVLMLRLAIQIVVLLYKYSCSDKKSKNNYCLVYNHGFANSFSFFKWIFINDKGKSEEDVQKIITHERVHVNQYHTVDVIVIEVLVAIMWFNPLVWMMRKSIHLVHEYLADEGVLNTGVDERSYQTLLINQVAEEKLISISSSFNQSLIKKRIIMMKNEKMIKKYRYVAFAIVPVVVFLFVGISCVNGQENADYEKKAVASVSATKMNVLYLGVDNPIKVAVSGYKSSEISVEITNGRIRGGDGEYIINPKKPGNSLVSVKVGEETVEVIPFRVKPLPYPRVEVGGMSGGEIRKSVLLAKEGVVTMMPNFDFDLRFVVQSFTVSTTDEDGYYVEVSSDSNKFTREQKQLIEKSRVGSRVNIEKVKAVGPDGSIRLLQAIVFEIVE